MLIFTIFRLSKIEKLTWSHIETFKYHIMKFGALKEDDTGLMASKFDEGGL
jgi:hypothetical protein